MAKRITDGSEVTLFRKLAKEFCTFVSHPERVALHDFLVRLESLLPQLCCAAQKLPEVERYTNYRGKWRYKTWHRLFKKLQNYFGNYDYSCYVFDPYDPNDTEPVLHSLSDDLADICRDLSPGLAAWKCAKPAGRRAVINDWRIFYDIHWGDHAITAWRSIHWLVHDCEVDTENECFKGHRIKPLRRKRSKCKQTKV